MNHLDDDDFNSSVLPPEPKPMAAPEPLEFKPWHKPRKQYVRTEQWLKHVKGVVEKLGPQNFSDGEPLRYMTLPGPDLLDIRLIAEFCSSRSIKLRYTGFCYSDENEERRLRQNVNEFSITHKDSVLESSRVVKSRLQEVGIKNSEASVAMLRGGPFDVVNIDACEPLASDDEDVSGRLVDAIRAITEYQLKHRRKSWILLLTTPIQIDSISERSLSALNGQVTENADKDADFSQELSQQFQQGENLAQFLTRMSSTNGDGLLSIFSLGLAKWLIHLAEQAHFKVIKLDGFCYSMFKKPPYDPNMVSLCFLFQPQELQIQDNTGLTSNTGSPAVTTPPVSTHIRALRKAFAIENLDKKLSKDLTLHDNMANQSKSLLREVGYPVDDAVNGYDAWLTSNG